MEAATPSVFEKISSVFTTLFPLWTLSVAILGLTAPGIFAGISTSYFTALLAALMLSMGITLTVDDFKVRALRGVQPSAPPEPSLPVAMRMNANACMPPPPPPPPAAPHALVVTAPLFSAPLPAAP